MQIRGRPKPIKLYKSAIPSYGISPEAPMHASAFVTTTLPSQLQSAKLNYDIALEENEQTRIKNEIATLDNEMSNERARYQNVNKAVVRTESELITGSNTYNMFKRQKETLQREQSSSADRLKDLKSQQKISVSPVQSAKKSFRGITKVNPMTSGKSYVPVVPASSRSPLDSLGTTLKGASNFLTQPLIPEASALPGQGAGSSIAAKIAIQAANRFSSLNAKASDRMITKIVNAERKKAMKNATPEQVQKMLNDLKRDFPDQVELHNKKAAREAIGDDAGTKVYKILQEDSGSKVAFLSGKKEIPEGPTVPLSAKESAMTEKMLVEKMVKNEDKRIRPTKGGGGTVIDETAAKQMVATGVVLGTPVAGVASAYADVYSPEPNLQTPKATGNVATDFINEFFTGASHSAQDLTAVGAVLDSRNYDADPTNDTIPETKSHVYKIQEAAVTQVSDYLFAPDKFAAQSKAGTLPFDMAIKNASQASFATLAGEAAFEVGLTVGTFGVGRVVWGIGRAAKIAHMAALPTTKTKAAQLGMSTYIKTAKEVKPLTTSGLKKAKEIKAGGWKSVIKEGSREAGYATIKDPLGIQSAAGVNPLRIAGKIPGLKRIKKTDTFVKMQQFATPKGQLPKVGRVEGFFSGKGSVAAAAYKTTKRQTKPKQFKKPIKVKKIKKKQKKVKQPGMVSDIIDVYARGTKELGQMAWKHPIVSIPVISGGALAGYSAAVSRKPGKGK